MWAFRTRKDKSDKRVRSGAQASARVAEEFGPPITMRERRANLSELEDELNQEMKCPAGRNQVFIRSLLTGDGTTQPRIALKCHLRKDVGLKPAVYYEHIREVCSTDPEHCEAYRAMIDRRVDT